MTGGSNTEKNGTTFISRRGKKGEFLNEYMEKHTRKDFWGGGVGLGGRSDRAARG